MLSQNQKILMASVVAVAIGAGLYWQLRTPVAPRPTSVQAVMPAELLNALADVKEKPAPRRAEPVAETEAVAEVVFERSGTNTLQLKVTNVTAEPFTLRFAGGTIFEDDRAGLILLKPVDATVQPGGTLEQELAVAALSSASQEGRGKFKSTTKSQPKLEPLIRHLASHQELPAGVVQTAVLAILEDAPVDLFARFPRPKATGALADDTFKTDTWQIIAALQLQREIGTESGRLSHDSQLKIEAMIDLKAHDFAKQYYGITSEAEWMYWRHELLAGDPSTRHYALYGIARFYPDVALQMMPKWALESRTAPQFRRAAIGALALTQKSAAKQLLQNLGRGLAREKELAQRVEPALRYLEQNLPNAL